MPQDSSATKAESEKILSPEIKPETEAEILESQETVEQKSIEVAEPQIQESEVEEQIAQPIAETHQPSMPVGQVVAQPKDRIEQEIEDVMQEDLTDLYLSMTPKQQAAFKIKGEETSGLIRKMFDSAKINIKKIFQLIRDWMKMIPKVNKYFLEQEAKIKTDKILLIEEEEKKQKQM